MWRATVLTIFPEMFPGPLGTSLAGKALAASLWSYHDYTTISPGALSDALARRALEPARRAAILARTRGILNQNYPIIAAWLEARQRNNLETST